MPGNRGVTVSVVESITVTAVTGSTGERPIFNKLINYTF
jgi:hypothetical protein